MYSPNPRMRTTLHLVRVHQATAMVANLIMMNLQTASDKVSQIDTVCMMLVNWTWTHMKTPHDHDHWTMDMGTNIRLFSHS